MYFQRYVTRRTGEFNLSVISNRSVRFENQYISASNFQCGGQFLQESRSLCSARSSLRSEQQNSECSGSELLQDNPFLKSFTLIRTAAAVSVRSALLHTALCTTSPRTSSTTTILELTTALWLLVGRSFLGMEHQ